MYQYDMDMKCWTEVVDAEIKHNAMSKFQQNNGADDDEEDGATNHDECQINNTHCEQMADSEILSAFSLALSLKQKKQWHKKQLLVNL